MSNEPIAWMVYTQDGQSCYITDNPADILPNQRALPLYTEPIPTDEDLLRQALEALEILRTGLIEMREHAESYGKAWARAYVKEFRELLPGSAEEHFRALNAMQRRLAVVADGVIKGYDAIAALRERLAEITNDLNRCPNCGGPADNGHDREVPPNPYWCSKCTES